MCPILGPLRIVHRTQLQELFSELLGWTKHCVVHGSGCGNGPKVLEFPQKCGNDC